MKRKKSSVPTQIWTYGCLPPVTGAAIVDEQLKLARRYKNLLIEIEIRRLAAVRVILGGIPGVVEVQAEANALITELERLRTEISALKQAARGSAKTATAALKQRSTEVITELKTKRVKIKELKSAGKESVEVALGDANEIAAGEIKVARAGCGVYWGTYLLVEKEIEQARNSKQDLHHRKWNGNGRVGVQFQGGLSVVLASSGEDTRLRMGTPSADVYDMTRSKRRKLSRGEVFLRVGSNTDRSPIFASFPCIYHRPLPADAVIKWAWVKRTKVGLRYRYDFQVTVESKTFVTPKADKNGTTVAIDIGWRNRGLNELRVGYFRDDNGNHGELRLPETIVSRLAYCEVLRTIQDRKFDVIKVVLGDWLKKNQAPASFVEKLVFLSAWRSCRRLSDIAWEWRNLRFDGDAQIFEQVDAWRIKWRHLYQWECDQRKRTLGQRRELYRTWAVDFAGKYDTVVFEGFNLQKIAELPKPESSEKKAWPGARKARHVTSPSELREAFKLVCGKRGTQICVVPAAFTTMTCHVCGHVEKQDAAASIWLVCPSCKTSWDQDDNAAWNILAAYHMLPGASGDVTTDEDDTQVSEFVGDRESSDEDGEGSLARQDVSAEN